MLDQCCGCSEHGVCSLHLHASRSPLAKLRLALQQCANPDVVEQASYLLADVRVCQHRNDRATATWLKKRCGSSNNIRTCSGVACCRLLTAGSCSGVCPLALLAEPRRFDATAACTMLFKFPNGSCVRRPPVYCKRALPQISLARSVATCELS